MKMQQLEYIIAIAQAGSITAAAKNLYQAQPNISIALKELETEIGMQIFWRTPNGMILTPEGEEFLVRAKDIVESMHGLEADYTNRVEEGITLRISAVRSAYIAGVLGDWVNELDKDDKLSLRFYETNTNKAIDDVNSGKSDIGIIRIPESQYDVYIEQMSSRRFFIRPLISFMMQPVMSTEHPLADREEVSLADLENYPEIVHADDEMKSFEKNYIDCECEAKNLKRIYVQDNGSKMIFLQKIKDSYMWAAPGSGNMPKGKTSITSVKCSDAVMRTVDIMICKKSSENNRPVKVCMDYLAEKCENLPGSVPFPENIAKDVVIPEKLDK